MVGRVAVQHGEPEAGRRLAEAPEAQGAMVHGILGAQPMVGRIGIRHEFGIHGVELHLGHGG